MKSSTLGLIDKMREVETRLAWETLSGKGERVINKYQAHTSEVEQKHREYGRFKYSARQSYGSARLAWGINKPGRLMIALGFDTARFARAPFEQLATTDVRPG
jgi:hypothetical protein